MWKGVLHVVPPASTRHQKLETRLAAALLPAADARQLELQVETGVFASDDDYRVPDIVLFDEAAGSERGVNGPPLLVVEIRSPHDETDDKVPWYLARGAGAVLVVDRDSLELELFDNTGRRASGSDGSLRLDALGIEISVEGGSLRVDGRSLDI